MITARRLRLSLWLALLALLALSQLVFWQDSTDPFAPVELAVIKLLVPLGLLPWLLASGADWKSLFKAWPARLLAAWAAWLWVSAALSPFKADGFKTAFEYTLYALLFFLPAVCNARQRHALLSAFLTASLLSAAYGVFQHFGIDPWKWSTDFSGRPLGTIGNPNFFGGHLVLAWGLSLAWLLSAPKGKRLYPGVAFGLLTLVQWYSRTVGVWLGMAGTAVFAYGFLVLPAGAWVRERWGWTVKRLLLGLAGASLLAGLVWVSPPGQHLLGKLREEKGLSVVNRSMMWKVAVDLWRTAPIQGAGLAAYRPLYPKFQADILAAEKDRHWNYVVTWLPHENFLYLLSETGLIGLGLFCSFWSLAGLQGWRRAAAGERWALAALLATVGMVGVSLLNTFSNIPPTALGFFFLLGLLAWPPLAGPRQGAAPEAVPLAAPKPIGIEALIACAVLALVMGTFACRELVANRFTREAGRYSKREDAPGAVLLYQHAAALGVANFTPQSLVGVDFQLGESLRKAGQIEAAIAAYRADLVPNPWAPETHNMLGAALGQLGASTRRGDLVDEGAAHLRLAEQLNPGYTTALLNLGGSYMVLGNISGAAQAWQELLSYEPGNEQAKAYLAGLPKAKRP